MAMTFKVSDPIETEIRRLRRENQKYRYQRNDSRAEADQLRAELGEAKAETERLREVINRSITARVVGR
jgi:HAMP domain-containing protein